MEIAPYQKHSWALHCFDYTLIKTDINILLNVGYSYPLFSIVTTTNFLLLAMMIDCPSLIIISLQVKPGVEENLNPGNHLIAGH